jgi:hypothetical protein
MIALEIQVLALSREGLLIEVGRLATECGFTLLRQRLTLDPHGSLLSMVVQGSWFKKRALRSALEACDRLVSFELLDAADEGMHPHFALTRQIVSDYVPPPAPPAPSPEPEPEAKVIPPAERPAVAPATRVEAPPPPVVPIAPAVTAPPAPPENFEAMLVARSAPPAPPAPAPEAYVELVELPADVAAVDAALPRLQADYPRLLPHLAKLDQALAPGARAASLQLAGQRLGAWLFAQHYAMDTGLALDAALTAIAVPALHGFVEVDLQGEQVHIHASPLCGADGHSGCGFYSGFLEGLLGPALARPAFGIFPVCCRSYGAADCVLAIGE